MKMEPLLTPQEVGEILRVPTTTLRQWRYKGVGPRGIRVGRHVRYRPADVEEWIESQAEQETRNHPLS